MDSLKIMILLSMVAAQNRQERLTMDLARLSFCWRNSQDHLKNNLCLPGMQKLPVITKIKTRNGLNHYNLQIYALYIIVNICNFMQRRYHAYEQRHKISLNMQQNR